MPLIARKRRKPSVITLADRARDSWQWGLAAQLYREALGRNPRNPPILVQYGHVLKEQGNLAHAESAYRTAIGYEQSNSDSYLQLGHVLKLQGKTKEAQSYLRAFALPIAASSVAGIERVGVVGGKTDRARGVVDKRVITS